MLYFKKSFLSLAAFLLLLCAPAFAFAENPLYQPVTDDDPAVYHEDFIYHIGLGLRGSLMLQSPIRLDGGDCVQMNLMGGPGYYIRGRFNRYLGLTFENDFLYGTYKDREGDMLKVYAALGLQGHILDYGNWNLYLTVSASAATVFLMNGGNVEDMGADINFWVFGGQFGIGASYVTQTDLPCEIGVEVRYIIEQAPDFSAFGTVNNENNIHAVLFTLNIGLAL